MKLRNILFGGALLILPLVASAAQIVVPAAGAGAGVNGSKWQSDVLLHNTAPRAITFSMAFHSGTVVSASLPVTLQPRHTLQMVDFVAQSFGISSGTGALVLDLTERDLKYLAVTSRTYNVHENGEYGQDIPAVRTTDGATTGDIAVLTNPATQATARFNFGIYAVESTTAKWELVRADGTVAATKQLSYAAGQHAQHNAGITSSDFFGSESKASDSVYARIISGRAVVYGSSINDTGDPSFVPSTRTRDDVQINFLGLDLDENGTIDVRDGNGDGVLDQSIDIYTSLYPAYFRVVAESEFGEKVILEVVRSQADAVFRDDQGTMRVGAAGDLKNTTGEIVLRASVDNASSVFTIPVRFR